MSNRIVILLCALMAAWIPSAALAQTLAPETEIRVRLTSSLSSRYNRKGDKISALVLSPAAFQGDMVEGVVKQAKSSGKVNKTSTLNFGFHTLFHQGNAILIRSQVRSFVNSRGAVGVDEEGQVIQHKRSTGKVVAATAVGAAIGTLLGGARGAALGAGAGLGASVLLVSVAVKGPAIRLAPGSELVLSISPVRE